MLLFMLFQFSALLFGEGSLSGEKVDYGIAFNPEENIAYVVRHGGRWGASENPPSKIHRYVKSGEKWINAGYASFSDKEDGWSDSDIFINRKGDRAFFVSNRPYAGKPGDGDPDIWMMKRKESAWGEPEPVTAVNSGGYEASPVTDDAGNLYFTSIRDEGKGMGDIYWAKVDENGGFGEPELLEGPINSEHGEWNLLVSPAAKWIIFESSGRPEGLSPYGDLFISHKNTKGKWGAPEPLNVLNTTGSDLNPRILYHSKQLVFASTRALGNAGSDFYVYPLEELEIEIHQ